MSDKIPPPPTEGPIRERTLHRKLAQVMYEAERIPKNGTAPAAMGGFKFVQVGDAADVIRKALAEQKISMIPTAIEVVGETEHPTSSGKMMTTLTVRTTWTLTDGDTGESTVIQSLGSGADMGDKAAPKAQSNAMKYALLMGFLLSTGDDPEQTDTSDRRSAPPTSPQATVFSSTNPPPPAEGPVTDGGLIGVAEVGKPPSDFELRTGPDGSSAVSFRLVQGRQSIKVVAKGPLADALAVVRTEVIGKRVTCWGTVSVETFRPAGATKDVSYRVLALERVQTPDYLLPATVGGAAGPSQTEAAGGVMSPSPAAPNAAEWDAEIAALPLAL